MINYRGLNIPFMPMGEITSDDLFGPNEQVIFDFYEANRDRYRRAVDVGANIGVHSILMARQGWDVRAYEPDPEHFANLRCNIATHGVKVAVLQAAVSDRDGVASFIRVLGNMTANHLDGARLCHGPTQKISVPVVDCRRLFAWADFVKMDCEGHEAVILRALPSDVWADTDVLLEVGSEANARDIYDGLHPLVPMWSQKVGWEQVRCAEDLPVCHQEGSLFIGGEPPFSRK